jgi:glucokinase
MLVLAGDIGATNTRFRLVETDDELGSSIKKETYLSGNEGLAILVQQFLGAEFKPEKACFAVAGFVSENKCKITNLPWDELDGEKLQNELNISKITLINDFVAIGYNIVLGENESLVTLQEGECIKNTPIAIIGAGTGLGKAFAIPDGNSYQVFPSEGGHANFAPYDSLTTKLLEYLQVDGTVDIEKVVSGPGIVSIFKFLCEQFPNEDAGNFLAQEDIGQAIATGAEQGNVLCQKTMDIFAEAYGAAAGDMAVSLLPFGGLYIAGGIAAKNIKLMQSGGFMRGFNKKARVNPALLAKVPVHIVSDLEGLTGAVKYASTKM